MSGITWKHETGWRGGDVEGKAVLEERNKLIWTKVRRKSR
jgi:hypothetical protein